MDQLKATFEGLRVVLIGDVHEQPMLHLKVKPFNINVRDWSGDVRCLDLLYRVHPLMRPTAVTLDNYTGNAHRLLEPQKFALGTLYVPNTHTLPRSSLTHPVVIDPWTFSATVRFTRYL